MITTEEKYISTREEDMNNLIKKSPWKKKRRVVKDGFHDSLKKLLFTAQFFGLFPLNGVLESSYQKMYFSWFDFRTLYALLISCAAIVEGIWCAYFLSQMEETIEIYELNVVIFYSRGTLTCLAFLNLAKNWPSLMKEFETIESLLRHYPSSKFLNTKLRMLTVGIFFAASVEHFSVQIMNFLKALRCEKTFESAFYRFFVHISYRQIFSYIPYHILIGGVLQILNMFITFGWTFIDVFIVYASIHFAEKLIQFNKQISLTVTEQIESPLVWRNLRENYTRLLQLFTIFNENMDNIILVSFASNIFFLLTQLFSWMRLSVNEEVALQYVYFVFSVLLLIIRTAFVCYYGASISEESQNLINNLVSTPSGLYNEEVERFIVQVNTSPMVLTGRNYFSVTRSLILKIAGSIVTYELVMIQFTEENTKKSNGYIC